MCHLCRPDFPDTELLGGWTQHYTGFYLEFDLEATLGAVKKRQPATST